MTEHDNADEVTRLRAEVEDLRGDVAELRQSLYWASLREDALRGAGNDWKARAESAEAALTRVREYAGSHSHSLPGAWVTADDGSAIEWVTYLRAALDGYRIAWSSERMRFSRATLEPASPAPTDDEGISFERILTDPAGQFDLRGDLLASIEAWTNAPSTTSALHRP